MRLEGRDRKQADAKKPVMEALGMRSGEGARLGWGVEWGGGGLLRTLLMRYIENRVKMLTVTSVVPVKV